MFGEFKQHINNELIALSEARLYKPERVITTSQGSWIGVPHNPKVLNMCANNYLGLAQHPDLRDAAIQGLHEWGYGMASVRFICGTQTIHKQLEQKLSEFLSTEETILYPSCFDANGGLFEALFDQHDAIISDELNHASIIDGIRLSKASRYRYKNNDMDDLEEKLKQANRDGTRFKIITTDGVFSMDGYISRLNTICNLAEQYNALVHFDDCHATGVIGKTGRGTHEYHDCINRVDIITGTLGKALGGASGGYTSGRKEIIELLRQRSRPYLFSNTVAPAVVAGAIKAIEILQQSREYQERLIANTKYFRDGITQLGFDLLSGIHPIIVIMFYDADKAVNLANLLLQEGVYVIAFSYPVVPKNKARIRVQMSYAHFWCTG